MQSHKITHPAQKTYAVACDPLNDIYHEAVLATNQQLSTGLPVVVYGATMADVYDQLFSAYTLDENGNLDTYTERTATLSVDYSEAEGNQTAAEAMEIIDGLMTRPIKHPDRNEWAMAVNGTVLARAQNGDKKDALLAKHLDKVNNGHNKSKSQAKDDNWHKGK
tara:strand:+ start:1797 stop:2288 length:492 start_codon:yes stop_codon:yes gene_type:complete